ncbi:hypothetical protein QQF64_031924, partial [Cirrhinus molitorella]
GGSTPDQGGAGGTREPVELVGQQAMVETRELGPMVEPLGQRGRGRVRDTEAGGRPA